MAEKFKLVDLGKDGPKWKLNGKSFSSMTPNDKVLAAATMYGTGSKQHLAAKRKFLK